MADRLYFGPIVEHEYYRGQMKRQGVRIAIIVEGETETAFATCLRGFLKTKAPDKMPKLVFRPQGGHVPTNEKLRRIVRDLLDRENCDAVIALTDVYKAPYDSEREDLFKDAAEAKRKMREWVGDEARFFPHTAQHEFEAWLLPYWEKIDALSKRKSSIIPNRNQPEKVNHGKSPGKWLEQLFRDGTGREYDKVIDGAKILNGQDLAIAAAACPELKAFLNTLLDLADGEPL